MEAYNKVGLIVALFLALAIGSEPMLANGQSLCQMTKEGLKACQPSVSGLNPVPPSTACCLAISNADMACLCQFKNSKLLTLYGIDPKLAMQLPAQCNLVQFHC